jgi:riboflavin synthase alpha subunit
MKKALLLSVVAVFSICRFAYAHSPADVDLEYDPVTKTVTVVITHSVTDGKAHYVEQVDVAVNGEKVISQKIGFQDDKNTQTVSYMLPDVGPGDSIAVEASCNIRGSKTKLLEVE